MASTHTSSSRVVVIGLLSILLLFGLLTACNSTQAQQRPLRRQILERLQQRRNSTDRPNTAGTLEMLSVPALSRTYYQYTPTSYRPNRPTPLILGFHGGSTRAEKFSSTTDFNNLADREGFIVVYPQAIDRHWNDGLNTPGFDPNIDDVAFVRALIEEVKKNRNIDSRRIYATGISNGGFFTIRLACEMSDRIAAFAPVAAALAVNVQPKCQPKNPVSILLIGSPNDTFVPWLGGRMNKGTQILSMGQTVEFWKNRNGCTSREEIDPLPDRDPRDGTEVESSSYSGCRRNTEVRLLRVEGGGHTWPGGYGQPRALVGQTSRDINGSEVVWNFFKRHTLP